VNLLVMTIGDFREWAKVGEREGQVLGYIRNMRGRDGVCALDAIAYTIFSYDNKTLSIKIYEGRGAKGAFINGTNYYVRLIDTMTGDTYPSGQSSKAKTATDGKIVMMTLSDVFAAADQIEEFAAWKGVLDDFKRHIVDLDPQTGDIPIISEQQEDSVFQVAERLLKENTQLVLTGAPGTGKTFMARKLAERIVAAKSDPGEVAKYIAFVQFHPSYDYSDFVEGIRPVGITGGQLEFRVVDGVFKAFCRKAVQEETKNFVFIIDEVNRAELPRVFGELLYCLEPGYRGQDGAVSTQYSQLQGKEHAFALRDGNPVFFIPKNVYIVGTMNNIDRSVEVFDFALRRRFAWLEIRAIDVMAATLASMLDKRVEFTSDDIISISERAISLNKAISSKGQQFGLSEQYHLGPAYFSKIKKMVFLDWESLWEHHLAPVLYEYVRGRRDTNTFLCDMREAFGLTRRQQ